MLLQGRTWNEISDRNWKNKIVTETYRQKSTKLWWRVIREVPRNITL